MWQTVFRYLFNFKYFKKYIAREKSFTYVVKDINSDIDTMQDFKYAEYNLKKRNFN